MATKTLGRVRIGPNDNVDNTSKNLGFKINDVVKINRKFFLNHGMIPIDLGYGVVQGKTQPTATSLPKIIVRFRARKEFFDNPELKQLLFTMNGGGKISFILLQIHPVYLEKVGK